MLRSKRINGGAIFGCLLLSLTLLIGACTARQHPQASTPPPVDRTRSTFYVATNGDDRWSGTLTVPNTRRTEGPLATLARALAVARDAKSKPANILLHGGTYFLSEPLVLGPEDSGVTIAAIPDEKPILSGGRRIEGWREVSVDGHKLWAADLPEVTDGKWFFRELWVNGQRARRARYPKHGYLSVAESPEPTADWQHGNTRFRFAEGDLHNWKSAREAEVVVMSKWVESRLPVAGIDEKERIVTFGKRSVFQIAPGDLYYIEHAFELLSEPGEWYLDRAKGRLYYVPRTGERVSNLQAIAPVLQQIARLEGHPEKGQFVQDVKFAGLRFEHTEWYFPSGFDSRTDLGTGFDASAKVGGFAQAAIGVPGAVWAEGARRCLFEKCFFLHLGSYALELGRGCQSNRIEQCEFGDMAAGGIEIGETHIRDNPAEQTRGNTISDCHIHDGGQLFHSAVGIWLGHSPDNRITHNLIHDFYYTGISIGWSWGYGRSLASNNLVAFNHVHHIGRKSDGDGPILSDMGGIYTLGVQPGARIENNLWHDIAGLHYGGWGIYFDEGTSFIVATSNIVYHTTHGGFHEHYGASNQLCNNVFGFGRDAELQFTRPEPHLSFIFKTNIVYFDSGALMTWPDGNYESDWNVFFDARLGTNQQMLKFGSRSLTQWRDRGLDKHSVLADPLFVAPELRDFRLLPNSPALKMGFQPIDLTQVGVRKNQ